MENEIKITLTPALLKAIVVHQAIFAQLGILLQSGNGITNSREYDISAIIADQIAENSSQHDILCKLLMGFENDAVRDGNFNNADDELDTLKRVLDLESKNKRANAPQVNNH